MVEQVRATAEPEPEPQPISPVESLIFGNEQDALEEETPAPAPVAAPVVRQQPMREIMPEPKAEPKRRRFFGGWAERKPELRTEPVAAPRSLSQPRATTQILSRSGPEGKRAQVSEPEQQELPEINRQEDFDIPAFLRRQTN
jgi:cell division protein FtsZ